MFSELVGVDISSGLFHACQTCHFLSIREHYKKIKEAAFPFSNVISAVLILGSIDAVQMNSRSVLDNFAQGQIEII